LLGIAAPVPIGVAGEISLAALALRAVLNRPELTAERFLTRPILCRLQAQMYKTGDLGRWEWMGTIEYLGTQRSHLLKIRGFPDRAGEIEAHYSSNLRQRSGSTLGRFPRRSGGGVCSATIRRRGSRVSLPKHCAFSLMRLPEVRGTERLRDIGSCGATVEALLMCWTRADWSGPAYWRSGRLAQFAATDRLDTSAALNDPFYISLSAARPEIAGPLATKRWRRWRTIKKYVDK